MTDQAKLDWTSGSGPRSEAFNDVYFSGDDGLAESRYVFLDGVGLPNGWSGRRRFTIGETGFGTGLNFLAAWDLWRRSANRPDWLHFVSVEAHPLTAADIGRSHARWPELARLSAALTAALPPPTTGFHRRHFDDGRVTLTLIQGDGAAMFAQLIGRVDAWFLDGFAPERNPDLWSAALFATLARLSAPGARLATFTAAGGVRRSLADAGFTVERRHGFGRKRHMTVGRRATISAPTATANASGHDFGGDLERRAVVLGAGVGGCVMAHALRRRDWSVTVIDRNPAPGTAASGNPAALIQPRAQLNDDPWTLFGLAADSYTRHIVDTLSRDRAGSTDRPLADWCGGLELAIAPREKHRQAALADWRGETRHIFRSVTADEASDIAGIRLTHPGRWYRDAGWISPVELLTEALGGIAPVAAVACRARRDADGLWHLLDDQGVTIASAPVLILATGGGGLMIGDTRFDPSRHADIRRLTAEQRMLGALRPARGRVTDVAATADTALLRCLLSGDGYITPARDGRHRAGATYAALDPAALAPGPAGGDPAVQAEIDAADDRITVGRIGNLAPALQSMRPVGGRTGIRITTADRRPFAGALAWPGLFTLSALGSRGYGQAWLLAELLASRFEGDPLPLPADQIGCVDPARFDRF